MTIEQLIQYIKDGCMVSDPNITQDTEFIALSNEQVLSIIMVSCNKIKADMNNLESGELYKVSLLARKEIFDRLATLSAPLYNLEGDGNTLSRSDRFDHYYDLLALVEVEYQNYLKEEELNRDVSNTSTYGNEYSEGEALLDSRYFTRRNYMHSKRPIVVINTSGITETSIDVDWALKRVNRFSRYVLLLSETSKIVDEYENTINPEAKILLSTIDIHKTKFRIKDLKPSTTYNLAVVVHEQNGLYGYDEINFVTTEI